MFTKLLLPILTCLMFFSFKPNVYGQDTIPPTITFDSSWFDEINNNPHNDKRYYLSNDTLEIKLSCSYSFPEDYYFQLENAIIEDNSGVFSDTIILDDIIYDDNGYGTVFQTIIAEDIAGNSSKFVIKSIIGDIPDYVFIGFDVGDIQDYYDDVANTLEFTDFEFCKDEIIEIAALYLTNECTGYTKIDWYINDELVSSDTNRISIDLNKQNDHFKVEAEANFNNINQRDRIGFDIQKTITFTEIQNPTCLNSADGSIKLDPGIIQFAEWGHSNSNATYLDSLVAGTYYVSYYSDNEFNVCEFHDTITLVPENTLDFTISDTIIDLNQKDYITINNISTTAGEYLWQIGDSSFVNNTSKFDYAFSSPGNYEVKLTNNSIICDDPIKHITVTIDTIPPKIIIDEQNIRESYNLDQSDLGVYISYFRDTLQIELSCLYSFPSDYYLDYYYLGEDVELIRFEDESGISSVTSTDTIIYYDNGYGKVVNTIIAEDYSGNTSTLVMIITIGAIYSFDFEGMKVGDIDVYYDYSTNSLNQTVFEYCESKNVEVEVFYNKNGCTGKTKIDWYKNDVLAVKNYEKISLDLSNETGTIELAAEARFNNTNFEDRFKLNIRKITKDSLVEVINTTCSNSTDGIIRFDPNVIDVSSLKHNGLDLTFDNKYNNSNEIYFDSLETGTYYVSYSYETPFMNGGCFYNDTITLIPGNILDFTISDTIINLSQNELLTVKNTLNTNGDYFWQIGDSSFVNNTSEFDYEFQSPGNYEIKLIKEGENCNDTIYKNIVVESTTSVQNNSFSNIKIGPNPFINILNVELGRSSDYKLTIYGIDGIAYFIDQFRDIRNMEVDLNFLNPGVYVLNIASIGNTELIKSFKIVKCDY